MRTETTPAEAQQLDTLVRQTESLAEQLATWPTPTTPETIANALAELGRIGLLKAPLPRHLGGLGLGSAPGTHLPLLRILSLVGGADLSLGRLFEGHVNALVLANAFATPAQLSLLAQDAEAGLLSGVWNTGTSQPLSLVASGSDLLFQGKKAFASGIKLLGRPILTTDIATPARTGWQMVLLDLRAPAVADHLVIDEESWSPLGMEASGSFTVDFTGIPVDPSALLGQPGDFYREPLFRGGAVRFAAVHAGAVLRLHQLFTVWLNAGGKEQDPYAIARLGELTLLAQSAMLWIEAAASVAEQGLSLHSDKHAVERMLAFANSTRLSIERLASAAISITVPGVGARGLLRPNRFEQLIRDLTLYLRQPFPDQTLADVGRASLRNLRLHRPLMQWTQDSSSASLSPAYFDDVYRQSADPWNFETSPYETDKYGKTIAALGQRRFSRGLEIGCSIGVLTRKLALHCDALVSVDVSEQALDLARKRLGQLSHVRFERLQIPREMPDGQFDLVVVSEVAYYWQREELECAATLLASRQQAGGTLLLVHFTDVVPDYPLTGDQVHEAWLARPEWKCVHQERHPHFRLDLLERC